MSAAPGEGTLLCLEPIGGIAGDMLLAALLHLGESLGRLPELRRALEGGIAALAAAAGPGALDLHDVRVETSEVFVSGIRAFQVEVVVPESTKANEPGHRAWRTIKDLLGRAAIPERARTRALAAFARLAEAEGQVHGIAPDEVWFHEVGAVDAIVDLTGAALLLDVLAPADIVCLPPPAGGGMGRSAHGQIPLPAPATLNLMTGRTLRPSGDGERTTPTGAALVAALTTEALALPELTVLGAGYGAGSKRWGDAPNLLRATLGRRPQPPAHDGEPLFQLEANLDDLSPQLLAVALQALLDAGARDAWIAPVLMKKGRPGQVLCALAGQSARAAVEAAFFRETTTLGVRAFRAERTVLERRFAEVPTRYGPVRIKLGLLGGSELTATPEFEDCAAAARAHGVSVREVIAAAITAWRGAV